jgi:hypothetical protein
LTVAVVDETGSPERLPVMESLLQGIEHKVGLGRTRRTPAHDPAAKASITKAT